MSERIKLPEKGRTPTFFAEYSLITKDSCIIATQGWIEARGRGDEMMDVIRAKLQNVADTKNTVVVHQYEASTLAGKNLIARQPDYHWAGRSSSHNSLYEKRYNPKKGAKKR